MSKNPEIRFKDDVNDWEEKELKDVILYNEKSKFPASHASDYGRYRFYKSDNGEDVTFSDDYIVDGKNIIINDGGQFNAKFSIGKIAYSDHCISFYTNENTEEEFVYQNITKNNDKINKEGFTGGALKNIDREYFNNFKISIPDKVQQEKISSLLSSFDKKIKLEEETIAHLKSVKASMLQKMFPKDGQKIPEIRFAGFTDDWEQRKVSELCSISTGKSNTQDKVEDGEYPFYVRSPIIERSAKYLYDEEAVLTVGDGVGTGKVFHYVNGKYDLHQRCYRMYDFTDELNAHYFYHTFSKLFYKRVMAMTAKTSVDSVRLEMIADMEIPCPDIKEQKKIGAYFDNLDNLITLHQRKYDKLIEIKQALLQKLLP